MSYLYAVDVPDMASSNFHPEKGTCTALYIYLFIYLHLFIIQFHMSLKSYDKKLHDCSELGSVHNVNKINL